MPHLLMWCYICRAGPLQSTDMLFFFLFLFLSFFFSFFFTHNALCRVETGTSDALINMILSSHLTYIFHMEAFEEYDPSCFRVIYLWLFAAAVNVSSPRFLGIVPSWNGTSVVFSVVFRGCITVKWQLVLLDLIQYCRDIEIGVFGQKCRGIWTSLCWPWSKLKSSIMLVHPWITIIRFLLFSASHFETELQLCSSWKSVFFFIVATIFFHLRSTVNLSNSLA